MIAIVIIIIIVIIIAISVLVVVVVVVVVVVIIHLNGDEPVLALSPRPVAAARCTWDRSVSQEFALFALLAALTGHANTHRKDGK